MVCIHDIVLYDAHNTHVAYEQPLAVDLLNPSAEAESKKHKLKRLVQSPNSYFMDVKCPGAWKLRLFGLSVDTESDSRRMLQYFHRLLSCADRRHLQFVFQRAVPAYRCPCEAH